LIGTVALARPQSPVKTVEVTPAVTEAEVGQQLKMTAVAKDESGKTIDVQPSTWFAAPFDVVSADRSGNVTFYNPGEAQVGAVVAGKVVSVRTGV